MGISTAIDANAIARVVGIKPEFVNRRQAGAGSLPQRVAIIGQGSSASTYALTPAIVTSAQQVGELVGFGSPLHLAALQVLPPNGDGVGTIPVTIYPLEDDASGAAAAGDITPAGAQTVAASYVVRVNNIDSAAFTIDVGDAVADICTAMAAAINAVLEMPVTAAATATEVDVTAKWEGVSSNDLSLSVVGSTTAGTTFAFTQPTGGLVNPDVDDALNQIGNVWETMVINCMEPTDTATLEKIRVVGDGRWGATVRKPFVAFTGAATNTVSTVSDGRKTDRVNAFALVDNSTDLPLTIAARQVARIASRANNNPARDYGGMQATGLYAGGAAPLYPAREALVAAGSSTSTVEDGVVVLSDIITFYHPTGEADPPYRYVVDIVKLQNIIYHVGLIFESQDWNGAPLIPDDQPTVNRAARTPRAAKAAVGTMLDNLGLAAIISAPEVAKKGVLAEISSSNPKRLDIVIPVQLSGNTNIISTDIEFGFFFGSASVVV